jgi:general secretion pathway protein A
MELAAAGLKEQPFRTHGKSLVFVRYSGQEAALEFLQDIASRPNGLGLFQGPKLSGKSTLIREFVESVDEETAVAVVDGAGLNTTAFLSSVLSQFGYEIQFDTVNELVNMVRVFALQQTAVSRTPLLIVENTHAMNPSALRVLCELAEIRMRHQYALRIILASDRSIEPIISAPAMESVSTRLSGNFYIDPMTESETVNYLFTKLRAGGCDSPESVIPAEVGRHLHRMSGGWPGIVDRLVLLAIARSESCPIDVAHIERPLLPDVRAAGPGADEMCTINEAYSGPPRLILTHNGKTLNEVSMDRPRLLIGRSEHNDLCVNSKYISRHHALLVRHGRSTFLMDLNSTNGTYVNSRRVSNHVMQHDDIVSIGQHGIKFVDPAARDLASLQGAGFADTVIMKSLDDIRRLLAKEKTVSLPAKAEDSTGTDPDS